MKFNLCFRHCQTEIIWTYSRNVLLLQVYNISFTNAKFKALTVQQCSSAQPQHPCFFSFADPAIAVSVVNSFDKIKKYLSSSWVNAHCSVEIFFCGSFQNQGSKSLSNFSCMWTKEMESNNSASFSFVCNQFGITVSLPFEVHIPFQGFENAAVSNDIFTTKNFSGFFFWVPTASILERSKDSGGNILVAH